MRFLVSSSYSSQGCGLEKFCVFVGLGRRGANEQKRRDVYVIVEAKSHERPKVESDGAVLRLDVSHGGRNDSGTGDDAKEWLTEAQSEVELRFDDGRIDGEQAV